MTEDSIEEFDGRQLDRPVIAVDFDGVVTNPHKQKSQEFQKRGYDISERQTDRNYCLNVRDIKKANYEAVSHEVNVARLDQVPIRDEAAASLQQLVDEGLYPVLVTSRHDEEIPPMLEYVRKHRLPVSEYLNTGRDPKIDAIETLGACIVVDDSLSKLERFVEEKDGEQTLIFFQNEANSYVESIPEEVHVVDGWDALVACILRES